MKNKSFSRVALISLGCVRNTVDSQDILGSLTTKGYQIVPLEQADTVFINTCAFIKDAKQESIDTILDMVNLKKEGRLKKIVVTGCLSERYAKQLAQEIPEIDVLMGTLRLTSDHEQSDIQLTPPHYAYLKICESCYHACSFCIIPRLKGPFRSRQIESILKDVKRMDTPLVKEINIVGQDITAYGMDLYGKKSLAILLKQIVQHLQNVSWVRLLYAYPTHITDELLDVMANEKKVCHYLDIPFQHVNNRLLKMMHRKMTQKDIIQLIEKIRKKMPDISLRTSYIVGFPGETSKEFKELLKFIHQYPIERVGVFSYSKEEGTPSARFKDQVASTLKEERRNILMKEQQNVSYRLNQRYVHQTISILIEQKVNRDDGGDFTFMGRSIYDAPDVDGQVKVLSNKELDIGHIVEGEVISAEAYDMTAKVR